MSEIRVMIAALTLLTLPARAAVGDTTPGKTTKVKVIRKGQEKIFDVTIAEKKEEKQAGALTLDEREEERAEKPQIGLLVDDLTPATERQLGLKSAEGIIIKEVTAGSLADDASLKENDVILELNGKKVENALEFTNRIKRMKTGENIVLKVLRSTGRASFRAYYFGFNKP